MHITLIFHPVSMHMYERSEYSRPRINEGALPGEQGGQRGEAILPAIVGGRSCVCVAYERSREPRRRRRRRGSKVPSKFAKSRDDSRRERGEQNRTANRLLECFPTRGLKQQNVIYEKDRETEKRGKEGNFAKRAHRRRRQIGTSFGKPLHLVRERATSLVKGRRNRKPFKATFS